MSDVIVLATECGLLNFDLSIYSRWSRTTVPQNTKVSYYRDQTKVTRMSHRCYNEGITTDSVGVTSIIDSSARGTYHLT